MAKPEHGEEIYTVTHTELGVSTSSQAALAANESRSYMLFINDSDTIMYLRLGEAAVKNEGIRLNAAGGSYEITASDNMYQGAVNAVHGGTGSKILLIVEGE